MAEVMYQLAFIQIMLKNMVIIYHFTPPRIPINSPNVDTGLL